MSRTLQNCCPGPGQERKWGGSEPADTGKRPASGATVEAQGTIPRPQRNWAEDERNLETSQGNFEGIGYLEGV